MLTICRHNPYVLPDVVHYRADIALLSGFLQGNNPPPEASAHSSAKLGTSSPCLHLWLPDEQLGLRVLSAAYYPDSVPLCR